MDSNCHQNNFVETTGDQLVLLNFKTVYIVTDIIVRTCLCFSTLFFIVSLDLFLLL